MFSWFHASPSKATQYPIVGETEWQAAEDRLPALDFLQDDERLALRALALEFLARKEFSGGGGFEFTDAILLEVALTACLPVLKLGLDWYEGWVGVIVYPGDFLVPRRITDEAGVLHEYEDVLAGEAWRDGPVILSWFDEPTPGVNAIIHEFAHKLDMAQGGSADGLPPLPAEMDRRKWIRELETAYQDFRQRVFHAEARGRETELDPYAAENPAEFFAVMSEAFFETPLLLQEQYPGVYQQLSGFYRQDPAPREAAWLHLHQDSP